MANPNFPRVTADLVVDGTLPNNHLLRTIFSQFGIQDTLFGHDSIGGLDRDDYDSLQVLLGRFMPRETQARMMPLRCQVSITDANTGFIRPCATEAAGNLQVRRCEGSQVDQAGFWGQRNNNFPGNARLGYHAQRWPWQPTGQVKSWTAPQARVHHPGWPKPVICDGCQWNSWGVVDARRYQEAPFGAQVPNRRRWARFCKQHCMQLRNQHPNLWPRRAFVDLTLNCDCSHTHGRPWSCETCAQDTENALVDRAQHWRNELLHTYTKQKRQRRRQPYVDMNKAARKEPACPWKNCGARPWIGHRRPGEADNHGDADAIGLSLCLACSAVMRI